MAKVDGKTSELFERGLEIRRAVLGADYVDNSIANADDFMMEFQKITTEWCWGYAWSRPGLERKTRSLINIAMIPALNPMHEVRMHVRGALRNGCTEEEIREVLMQVGIYAGIPAAVDSFRLAREAFAELDKQ